MKNIFKSILNKIAPPAGRNPESRISSDLASNTGHIYNLAITWLIFLSLLVITLMIIFLKCNLLSGVLTFLLVSGASFAGGASIGFLFGLPRAEKYRFIKKDDTDHNAKDHIYSDNTNLEEVSDWLSKIIVGLTLIKLNTIIGWIDKAAHSIQNVFIAGCRDSDIFLRGYVFGYCVIILYFLAGAGLCYLWARTNLSVILTKSKQEQKELEKQRLIATVQSLTNTHLGTTDEFTARLKVGVEFEEHMFPSENFKNITEGVYNAKPVYDKTDIQKKRWGGEFSKGNYMLEGNYPGPGMLAAVYKVQLVVRSLDPENPLTGEVAFFLHDTFPSQIVYAVAKNNKAEITIQATEAFVAGARLENKVELEIDLNKVKGFPEAFYWKE